MNKNLVNFHVLVLKDKQKLLDAMDALEFATAGQKKVFAQMVCSSAEINTVEEMKLVHKHATLQAAVLTELASTEPPPTEEVVIERLAVVSTSLNAAMVAYAATLGEDAHFDFATKCTELKNISETALALLKNAEPPVQAESLQKLQTKLCSQAMRALIGQLDAMMGADILKELPEIDNIKLFSEVLIYMGKSLADAVGVENLPPRSYIGPLTAITQSAQRHSAHRPRRYGHARPGSSLPPAVPAAGESQCHAADQGTTQGVPPRRASSIPPKGA